MPFDLVSGTMGGGKTYFVAERCVQGWKEGAHVTTNIDFHVSEVEKRGWSQRYTDLRGLPVREWLDKIPPGIEGAENIVAVDEAALELHAYDQASNRSANRELFQFIAYSRKLGLEVYFITQDISNMDAAIRKLPRHVIHCVNVKDSVPVIGGLVAMMWQFKRHTCDKKGRRLTARYCSRSVEIDTIYDTFGGAGHEFSVNRNVTRKKPQERGPAVIIGVALSLLCVIYFGSKQFVEITFGTSSKLKARPAAVAGPAVPVAAPAAPVASPAAPVWIVNGSLRYHSMTTLYVSGVGAVRVGGFVAGVPVVAIMPTGPQSWRVMFEGGFVAEARYRNKQERKEAWLSSSQRPLVSGSAVTASPTL